jgi:tyrosine decarboxylase / aspartate 1-decarboxylase
MNNWKKLSQKDIKERVFSALNQNVNFYEEYVLGIPASHLDGRVFNIDSPILKEAPYLSTMVHNPNHIGCHTLGTSETIFSGTHQIERDLIKICSEDILGGEENSHDGYVASGGTEANMQAIWVYRNYFRKEFGAENSEIMILCSEDSHYSMAKSSNILNIDISFVKVNFDNRSLDEQSLKNIIKKAKTNEVKYFIVIANMMTTMFGSVDDVDLYSEILSENDLKYKIHIDGAFGGFFYPFSTEKHRLDFRNPNVSSVTLDAHKMVQAPYGTGIFIIEKGLIDNAITEEASYIEGEDYTIIGSRSGANAVAVWMILSKYGPYDWQEKITTLTNRTNWVCRNLDKYNIEYFRQSGSNIITIKADFVDIELVEKYGLVPDSHKNPSWFKIVIMDHVTIDRLMPMMEELCGTSSENLLAKD